MKLISNSTKAKIVPLQQKAKIYHLKGNFKNRMKMIAKNQSKHILSQGIAFGILEAIKPSNSILDVITRKLAIDISELFKFSEKGFGINKTISSKYNGTNILAYLADGYRKLTEK